MTPFIIGLPYDHPQPSDSWQFAYKKFGWPTNVRSNMCVCTVSVIHIMCMMCFLCIITKVYALWTGILLTFKGALKRKLLRNTNARRARARNT